MNINLASLKLKVSLLEWGPEDFFPRNAATQRLRKVAKSAGTSSVAFKNFCDQLLHLVKEGDRDRVREMLTNALSIRAYAHLLSTQCEFSKKMFPDAAVFDAVKRIGWPIGRQTCSYMVRAFFNSYGHIDGQRMVAFGTFINRALLAYPHLKGNLEILRKHGGWIFTLKGPAEIANQAVKQKCDLDVYIKKLKLEEYKPSNYILSCFNYYYLRQVEQLDVGEDAPVLKELLKPKVHNANFESGVLVGHKILEILIDRSPVEGASKAWEQVVLSIAKDPRVSRHAESYRTWWRLLGNNRIKKVTGWLSKVDLRVFLDVLKDAANASGKKDIKRMYLPRKIFMEGLLKQGLVIQSRLFLSRQARNYLTTYYDKKDIPTHAKVKSGDTSVIYLEMAGGLHMIEGTHSFKLKVIDRLPSQPPIMDFSYNAYEDSHLRKGVLECYRREAKKHGAAAKEGKNFIEEVHRGLKWQAKAIGILKSKNIQCEASHFFSESDYREFKKTFPPWYWA